MGTDDVLFESIPVTNRYVLFYHVVRHDRTDRSSDPQRRRGFEWDRRDVSTSTEPWAIKRAGSGSVLTLPVASGHILRTSTEIWDRRTLLQPLSRHEISTNRVDNSCTDVTKMSQFPTSWGRELITKLILLLNCVRVFVDRYDEKSTRREWLPLSRFNRYKLNFHNCLRLCTQEEGVRNTM